ncbi:secretin N-terminal domain-containing protein [Gloeobacter violaceus]|uniref:Gll0920 protein n=1 Tax=Gloeobacter violaceus (strain ATCC 29082 / PCC 7421) TaxID=251221 RepID=Q7NM49_GLOVI|nr:secretin N-terminal domain-containing protein [Gloeobacter violaceus]BAC88861.1 gll0920 [Gloeobacter violaceus PCC 7421]
MHVKRWLSLPAGFLLAGCLSTAAWAAPLAGIDVEGNTLRIRTAGTVAFQIERNTPNEVVLFLPGTEPGSVAASQETAAGTVSVQVVAGGMRLTYRPRALGSTYQVVAGQAVADSQTIEIRGSGGLATVPPPPPIAQTPPQVSPEERVSLKVRDGDVKDTLALLGRVARANVVTESSVSGRVSLNLEQVTFNDALTAVAQVAGLTINKSEGNVYVVSQLKSGLPQLPVPTTPGGADPSKRPVSFSVKSAELGTVVENISNQAGAQLIIKGQLSDRVTGRVSGIPFEEALGQLLNGTRYGFVREGRTYLIGDATPGTPTSRAIERTEAIALSFTQAKNVPKLIPASLTQFVKIDEPRNAVVVSGTDVLRTRVRDLLQQIDKPLRQVVFEVKIVELSDAGSRELNALRTIQSGSAVSPGNTAPLSLGGLFSPPTSFATFNDIARAIVVINGLITENKARVVTDTKLNTITGQKASIDVQTDINLILNQLTNVSGATVNNTTLSTLRAGTVVELTPTVQADGNVLAELSVESSVPQGTTTLTSSGTTVPPNIARRKVKNIILVKDGQTLEIGGLIQTTNREVITRVPFFGYIPLIGQLFSNTNVSLEQSELVVFITPRVRDVQPLPDTKLPLEPPR